MDNHIEYYTFLCEKLMKERMKITQRGRLSEEEDMRLNEIDAELAMYQRFINQFNV